MLNIVEKVMLRDVYGKPLIHYLLVIAFAAVAVKTLWDYFATIFGSHAR